MSDIQIFNNPEFGDVRTVIIDGEPYFAGNDVAKPLGYSAPKNAIAKFVDEEDKLKHQFDSSGQKREMVIINESGLYSLIFGSKMENAKKFKKWVTGEILPSIRKTGTYGVPQLPTDPMELLELHYQAIKQVDSKVNTLTERVDKMEYELPVLPVEAEAISAKVKRRGVECLGGKKSIAYRNRELRQKLYWDLHVQLRREFQVSTYKAIKRNQVEQAISFIESYEPPLVMKQEIAEVNQPAEVSA